MCVWYLAPAPWEQVQATHIYHFQPVFSFSFSVFFQLFIRLCNVCVRACVHCVCTLQLAANPSRARRARAAPPQTHSRLEVCNSGWLSRWNDGSLGILSSTSPPGGCFPLTAGYCVDSQNFTLNFPPLTQRLTRHRRRRRPPGQDFLSRRKHSLRLFFTFFSF